MQAESSLLKLAIKIYSRWGVLVHDYNSAIATENNIYINWDGKDKNGNDLPASTYYYEATVIFDVLDESLRQKKIKGTIQLLK